ncbi:MAG: Sec-independent protein translocase protein TatB [Candidimonas sp.]|jgi:sec-independent protein translocase protein TatB
MFDVSFSELLLIGVIALIVIGPERLPKVARTLGHLVGRAQRYVSDVKADIKREMDLEQIANLKNQIDEAASTVKSSLAQAGQELRKPLDEAEKSLKEASNSMENLIEQAKTDLDAQSGDKSADAAATTDASPAKDTQTLPLPGFETADDNDGATTRTGSTT